MRNTMNQMDAFISPPRHVHAHRKVRQRKALECTEKASAEIPKWGEQAYAFLLKFAAATPREFLGEEVIYCSRVDVPPAHDNRAWGSVFTKAARAGVIRRTGWSTSTKNASAKPVWVAS